MIVFPKLVTWPVFEPPPSALRLAIYNAPLPNHFSLFNKQPSLPLPDLRAKSILKYRWGELISLIGPPLVPLIYLGNAAYTQYASFERYKNQHHQLVSAWKASLLSMATICVSSQQELASVRDRFRKGELGAMSQIILTGDYGQQVAETYGKFYLEFTDAEQEETEIYALFVEAAAIGLAVAGGRIETAVTMAAVNTLKQLGAKIQESKKQNHHEAEKGAVENAVTALEAIKVGVMVYKSKKEQPWKEMSMRTLVSASIVREFIHNGAHLIDNDGVNVLLRWGKVADPTFH